MAIPELALEQNNAVNTQLNSANDAETVGLPIQAVEIQTGVSKEILRMWERRYGFPEPIRDQSNNRIYPTSQVQKLVLVKRLLESGYRPGKIIHLSEAELQELLSAQQPEHNHKSRLPSDFKQALLNVLKKKHLPTIQHYLAHQLMYIGLEDFVLELLHQANLIVADASVSQQIDATSVKLYKESVVSLLNQSVEQLLPAQKQPNVFITTASNDTCSLDVLRIEALLRLDNIHIAEKDKLLEHGQLKKSVVRNGADVIVVSFSKNYPANRAIEYLEKARLSLPIKIAIWAVGESLKSTRKSVDGVVMIDDLQKLRYQRLYWQRQHGNYSG